MLETLSTIPASGRLDSYGRAHPLGSLRPAACGLDFGYLVRLYILMVVYERLLVASGGSVHSCAHRQGSGPDGHG